MTRWLAPLASSSIMTAVLLTAARHSVTRVQAAMAFALMAIPCFAYADWRRVRRTQIPLFAVLAAAHTVFYCVSAFWTDILDESVEGTATAVLGMALLGVCGLYIGMRTGSSRGAVRRASLPDVPSDTTRWWLVRAIAACQIVVPWMPLGSGGEFRQLITILLTFVPLVAFLLLWDACLRGKGVLADKLLVGAFLAASVVGGLSSGWVGSCLGAFVLAGIGFVRVRRRLPAIPLAAIVFAMFFLQAGKADFRDRYWYGDGEAGITEKSRFWIERSIDRFRSFTSQPGAHSFEDFFGTQLLTRSSLVAEAASIYENTPALVPYQYGATYQYLLITFIPRFLWPNKPSVNDSNRFYQLSYGITQEEDLDHIAIGAGLIPEAYMNFGWLGVPAVMYLAGVLLGAFERIFLGRQAGAFATAVGLAYVLQLLALNGQAAAYFGGMAQMIGLTIVVFLPVLRFTNRKRATRVSWRVQLQPAVFQ